MEGPRKQADPAPKYFSWLVLASFIAATAVFIVAIEGNSPAGRVPQSAPAPDSASAIKHVVVIVQENHSFDSYFGRYCRAKSGSNPTCTNGPGCCEAGPASLGKRHLKPVPLTDAENMGFDPNHSQPCELLELNDGKMDGFVTNQRCGDVRNFAYATPKSADIYWKLAGANALADRYFQPIAGASSSNDMYFARAQFVFVDNTVIPSSIGAPCAEATAARKTYDDVTIGDLLTEAGVPWAFYAEGYRAAIDAHKHGENTCAKPHPKCRADMESYPCIYDPSDNPFQYYRSSLDNPVTQRDFADFATDLEGDRLPAVVFVKALGFRTEHPGGETNIRDGMTFVSGVVDSIAASRYAADTLVLVTFDESGGFYDHVPPPRSSADGQPYGARVPLLAIGKFARKGVVSHTQLEHSSIVKFIEWNWLGGVGQLMGRDAAVNNLGSLLDPAQTGSTIPLN